MGCRDKGRRHVTQEPGSPGRIWNHRNVGTIRRDAWGRQRVRKYSGFLHSPLTSHWCLHRPNPAGNQSTLDSEKGGLLVRPRYSGQNRDQKANRPRSGPLLRCVWEYRTCWCLAHSRCSINGITNLYAPMLYDKHLKSHFLITLYPNT